MQWLNTIDASAKRSSGTSAYPQARAVRDAGWPITTYKGRDEIRTIITSRLEKAFNVDGGDAHQCEHPHIGNRSLRRHAEED